MSPAFIFDLDGTLVDTAPDLLNALNRLLAREGRSLIDGQKIRHLVGRGARVLIEKAFAETGSPVEGAALDQLFADYLELYAACVAVDSKPYPGVVETLTRLQSAGAKMAVLTNKPHHLAEAILPAYDLVRFFPVVYGAGKRDYMKPDPRLIDEVLADLGAGKSKAVMVGDSITDVQTAHNASIPAILLPYGYTPDPVETLGADVLVQGFAEVPAAAAALWAARG